MFVSHEEVMARMSPERRAAIKKGAAKIIAEIDAAKEANAKPASAVSASAAEAKPSRAPMFVSHDKMSALLSPKERVAIDKAVAKEVARLKAKPAPTSAGK